MKKIIPILVLLVFPLVSAQNVFKSQKKIYIADYYAHQKNDKKALENYLEAILINPKVPSSYEYLDAAAIAFKIKDNDAAKKIAFSKYNQPISSS